jgi:hypothetical protein
MDSRWWREVQLFLACVAVGGICTLVFGTLSAIVIRLVVDDVYSPLTVTLLAVGTLIPTMLTLWLTDAKLERWLTEWLRR